MNYSTASETSCPNIHCDASKTAALSSKLDDCYFLESRIICLKFYFVESRSNLKISYFVESRM